MYISSWKLLYGKYRIFNVMSQSLPVRKLYKAFRDYSNQKNLLFLVLDKTIVLIYHKIDLKRYRTDFIILLFINFTKVYHCVKKLNGVILRINFYSLETRLM